MAHIVILGAGIGGMPAAYEMKATLGNRHEVSMVNDDTHFRFVPSNPWVAVGWRDRKAITFNLEQYLERKNIHFYHARVATIDAENNCLVFTNGRILEYDYLIIATGPALDFDLASGFGPNHGHTQSICLLDHAETAYSAYKKLLNAKSGHIVIGAMPYASCFGPAYEFAFIIDADLRKRKIRANYKITFVTSEPYIGHLGLAGVGDSKSMLESEFRNHKINWITNANTHKVEANKIYIDELDTTGSKHQSHCLDYDYAMMLPAFKGVSAVSRTKGLSNERGFVLVDKYQRNPNFHNIYAVGVCIAIPPVENTPVPTGAPKTGYMIESMVTAAVQNIASNIRGNLPIAKASCNAICFADMGDTGAAFVALPQMPPRSVAWIKKGLWVHAAKIAFEKYFIRKMKKGATDPIYEKYILQMLGIHKIKS